MHKDCPDASRASEIRFVPIKIHTCRPNRSDQQSELSHLIGISFRWGDVPRTRDWSYAKMLVSSH